MFGLLLISDVDKFILDEFWKCVIQSQFLNLCMVIDEIDSPSATGAWGQDPA